MNTMISISQTDVFTALRAMLLAFNLNSSSNCPVPIIRGQVNRVPEPANSDFVVMWPLSRTRLETNIHTDVDNQIVGSILNNILYVSSIIKGSISIGTQLTGPNTSCIIVSQTDGIQGSVGSYVVTQTPDIKSQTLYCGSTNIMQPTEMVVQADIHGPCSGDNAQIVSTLWRDQYAFDLAALNGSIISPFYSDEPQQIPFIDAEEQFEERWVVDLHFQINPVISVSQQFADEIAITTKTVLPNINEGIGGGGAVNAEGLIEIH